MSGDTLPTQIGPYRILKQLGAGGMGAVYLAEHMEKKHKAALKVPQLSGLSSEQASALVSRFRREAEATSTINHPNVCRVLDVGSVNGQWYLAMDYVPGRPLNTLTQNGGRLSPRQAAEIVLRIARGMHAVHQAGVIHRDLKPHNVILNKKNEPVVVDFGLAKNVLEASQNMTKTGAFLGTPVYAAPEQFRDTKRLGPSGDIYSLGVIFFELLTGRPPFVASSLHELLQQILLMPAPRPSSLAKGLDAVVDAICLRALEKDPDERYGTMRAFATDLGRYLKGETRLLATQPAESQRPLKLYVIGVAALMVLTVIIAVSRSKPNGAAPRGSAASNAATAVTAPLLVENLDPTTAQSDATDALQIGSLPTPAAWSPEEFKQSLGTGGTDVSEVVKAAIGEEPDTSRIVELLRLIVEGSRGKNEYFENFRTAERIAVHRLESIPSPDAADLLRSIIQNEGLAGELKLREFDSEAPETAADLLLARTPEGPWPLTDLELVLPLKMDDAARILAGRERPTDSETDAKQMIDLLRRLLAKQHGFDDLDAIKAFVHAISSLKNVTSQAFLNDLLNNRALSEQVHHSMKLNVSGVALQAILELDDEVLNQQLLTWPSMVSWQLVGVVQRGAGPKFRLMAAKRITAATTEEKKQLLEVIGVRHPINLPAQIELYSSAQIPPSQMSTLELWFWSYLADAFTEGAARPILSSAQEVYVVDGIAPELRSIPQADSSEPVPFPYPRLVPVYSWLPGQQMVVGFDPRPPIQRTKAEIVAAFDHPQLSRQLLSRLSFTENNRPLLLQVLASIPFPAARQAFRDEVRRGDKTGPVVWLGPRLPASATIGLPSPGSAPMGATPGPPTVGSSSSNHELDPALAGVEWLDPAALISLKVSSRNPPKEADPKSRSRLARPFLEFTRPSPKKPADIRAEWHVFVRQSVDMLCKRSLAASQAAPDSTEVSLLLPAGLKLPSETTVTASRSWTVGTGGAAPLTTLHYRRLASTSMSRRLFVELEAQCRGVFNDSKDRILKSDEDWIDLTWSDTSLEHSLDIVFRRESDRQIAEILLVEVPNIETTAPDAKTTGTAEKPAR